MEKVKAGAISLNCPERPSPRPERPPSRPESPSPRPRLQVDRSGMPAADGYEHGPIDPMVLNEHGPIDPMVLNEHGRPSSLFAVNVFNAAHMSIQRVPKREYILLIQANDVIVT